MQLYKVKWKFFDFHSWLFPWGPNVFDNLLDISTWKYNLSKLNITKDGRANFLLNLTVLVSVPNFTTYLIAQAQDLEIFLESSLYLKPT